MKGIVVCVDPRAADEGAKVLEAGGNAFDAAVATAFVQMVLMPFSCGVGGMVSAHLWKSETAQHLVVDGLLRAGSRVTDNMWADDYKGEANFSGSSLFVDHRSEIGYTSVCTPGAVAGLGKVHSLFGSTPWNDLLQPAANIARDGFQFAPVTQPSVAEKAEPYQPDAVTRVKATPDCARLFYRDTAPPESVVLRNPDYADTLERLGEHGADDFYHGDLARQVAQDLERNGAFVAAKDLGEYRTNIYWPMVVSYRDLNVYSNVSPGGGPLLLQALNVVDGLDLADMEHSSADHLSYLASTLQLVDRERRRLLGDPDHVGYDVHRTWVSQERAAMLRERVRAGENGGVVGEPESPDTTHLTVVDGDGNIASITHSNGQHSGVVTPGLGFVYNNGMNRFDPRPGHASSLAPGKARVHLMMPTLVFKNLTPVMALGAPGGNAILSALVQTLSNVADFGMNAVEAVSATRIHAEGSTIWCEARVRSKVVAELRDRGFTVVQRPDSFASGIARAQLVTIGLNGELAGGSDPRGSSSGVAYAR